MEFAPENRDGQGQEYAELFLSLPQGFVPYFSYLQEKSWFAGQTWRFDALTISRWWFDDQAPALAPGIYSLEGVDLDPLNCELCVELNTSNMDLVPPSNEIFQPIEATLNITEVEIGWRGAFKGTLSGRFIETNGTRTWCVNELPFETVFDLYCASIADCPTGATACDYAGNSTIPMCVGE